MNATTNYRATMGDTILSRVSRVRELLKEMATLAYQGDKPGMTEQKGRIDYELGQIEEIERSRA